MNNKIFKTDKLLIAGKFAKVKANIKDMVY